MEIDPRDALPPAPETTSEPAPTEPAPPAATPPVNPGPWAADLEQRFADPEQRQAVDQYLRDVWQPRMTQLEQRPDVPETASQLWNDLNGDNYAQAFLNLTGELFDEDVAQEVLGLLHTRYNEEDPPPAEAAQPPAEAAQPPARDPEVQALIEREQEREYNEAITKAVAGDPENGIPAIPEAFQSLLHPIVVSTQGDVEAAAKGLRQQLEAAGVLGQPAPTVEDVPEPPPAATADAPPAVPTQKKQTLEESIHDFWQEQQRKAPPPVGSV
jgi:hypothetical protein